MKLHKIEIENLNSLYGGPHVIDFDRDLKDAPLFLIMGSTGAGKTTILDAICLTLFGTTPRIRDEAGHSSVSLPAQRMMTEGTWHCRASLEFSLLDEQGVRQFYRASWRSERTHKSPTGRAKNPHRSLEHRVDGVWPEDPIASGNRTKDYDPAFEKVLRGMTEESFLRSVMLAQGQFSAFLRAKEDEKAVILERLTQTDEYRRIGARAGLVKKAKENRVAMIDTKLGEVQDVDIQSLAELTRDIQTLHRSEAKKKKTLKDAQRRADWLAAFETLHQEKSREEDAHQKTTEKKENHKEDFENLDLARRARPVEKPLHEVDRLTKELTEIREKKPDLQETLQKAEKELKDLQEAKKEALATLSAARKSLEKKSPEIQKAREVRVKWRGAKEVLATAGGAEESATAEWKKATRELEDAEKNLEKARDEKKKAARALEKLASFGVLVELLAGLESRYETIVSGEAALKERHRRLASAQKSADELAASLAKKEETLKFLKDNLEPLRQDVTNAEEALGSLFEEKSDDEKPDVATRRRKLRELLTNTQDVKAHITEARRLAVALNTIGEKRSTLRESSKKLTGEQKERAQRIDATKELVALRREVVETTDETLRRIVQTMALSTERETLEEGHPCPLCGSVDHPFLEDGTHDDDDARLNARKLELEGERKEKEREFQTAQKNLLSLQTDQKAAQKELESLASRQSDLKEEETGYRTAFEELITEEKLQFEDSAQTIAELDQKLVELDTRLTDLRNASLALDEADEARQKAVKTLAEAQKKTETTREEFEKLELQQKHALAQLKDLTEELKRSTRKLDDQRQRLYDSLTEAGVPVQRSEQEIQLAGGLEDARKKRDEFTAANKKAQETERAVEKALTRHQAAKKGVEETSSRLEKAKTALQKQQKVVAELDREVGLLLEGKNPDEVEKALKAAIEEADKAHTRADAKRGDASETARLAAQKVEDNRERLTKLSGQLEGAKKNLANAVREQDFSDVDQVRQALLPEAEFHRLREKLETIDKDLFAVTERLKSVNQRLKAHEEELPDELDPETADLQKLQATVEELTEAFEKVKEERIQQESKLSFWDQQLARRKELLSERQILEQDLHIWRQIHKMIGLNYGGAFQKYAQALNLRELIYRANKHLDTLAPRYSLGTAENDGIPTLDFAVHDSHHANKSRALSTLSGGETFLVSLAMALALADYHQSDLRMETLLLDEGFGTLDQDSLSTALSLLNSIHLDGNQQVGLISHVEALKERIPHRIRVRKLGNGRSTIEVLGAPLHN